MYPEICKIGPLVIYSYGLMLVIAFVVSSFLLTKEAKRQRMDPEGAFNLAFTAFIFGVIGARVFYILQNFDFFLSNPREIIMLQHGGLSWFGSLIFGSIAGAIYLKIKKLPLLKTLDLFSPYVALGQAIGRIGCYLNGCCFGKADIPTQIYSSLALLIIFLILRRIQLKSHPGGQVYFTYVALYTSKRFFMEFFRGDGVIVFLGFSLFQVLSIIFFIFAIANLILLKRKKR